MKSANHSVTAAQSSCDPSTHVRHPEEDSLQRVLIVTCIITALIMAAFKPARGASTDAEQCAVLKIAATGKYSLCRMQAEAAAEKTGEQIDFSKCTTRHTRAFERTETRFGTECPTSGDAAAIQHAVGVAANRLGCLFKGLADGNPPAGAAIVSVRGIQVTQTIDPTLTVANLSGAALTAYCFFVDADSDCLVRDFFVTVPAQSSVSWLASVGIQSQILPTTVPFDGEMVCLQVAAPPLPPVPVSGANLSASVTPPDGCPREGIGIASARCNNGDTILTLGGGANEYGACPASIGAARIEHCWSNSAFIFDCN